METWRLYSAEASVRQVMRTDFTLSVGIAEQILRSPWWRMLRYRPAVRIEIGGHEANGMVASHSYPNARLLADEWTLSLHPERSTERTVIHELAHVVTARYTTDQTGAIIPMTHHGAYFAGAYVEMLQEFSSIEDPQPLLEALTDYGVRPVQPDAWRASLSASLRIERTLHESGTTPPPEIALHTFGARMAELRRESGRSRQALADQLGCTPTHLRTLESKPTPPSSGNHRVLAVRAAIAYGMDPIEMTEIYKLTWDRALACEWAALNPRWAELLDQLNELLVRRPPWWERPVT